jgi:hypothetical protein
MKYRKKPIIVEAEQWFLGKEIEGIIYQPMPISGLHLMPPYIETLEGRMFVNEGDYIITGIEGEKYPCKKSIFEATYEKVEE